MPLKHEEAVLAVTQAVQAAQIASMVNPSISTIRRATWTDGASHVKDIRDGERIAVAITVAVGLVLAVLIEDTSPLWTSIIASAVVVAIYEWALATRAPVRIEAA